MTVPGDDLTCRPATTEDLPGLAELFLTARAAAVPTMPPVPTDAEGAVRRDISSWDLDRREVWVAEADVGAGGRPVGFAGLRDAWLESLYVAPASQRTGVGTMLLDLVRARRPDGFCLWVFASNLPARGFYARAGLVELEHTDGSGNSERAPDLRMAWPGVEPLRFLRGLIDQVDDELGDLLARRTALTGAVQHQKAADGDGHGDAGGGRDPGREADVVRRVAARVPALGTDRVARIVDAVISESLHATRSTRP